MLKFLPVGIIKAETVDDIFVSLQRQQLFSCFCIPKFTSAIITARDELIPIFIKRTVCQRLVVSFELFVKFKILFFVADDFELEL